MDRLDADRHRGFPDFSNKIGGPKRSKDRQGKLFFSDARANGMTGNGWVPWEDGMTEAWDLFVLSHRWGRFAHLSGFKRAVEKIYGLRSNYWAYTRGAEILAAFPSFFHRSLIYGRRLVSQPFSEYGGFLFAARLQTDEKKTILEEFPEVLHRSRERGRFDYLEIRCFPDRDGLPPALFREDRLYDYGLLRLTRSLRLWDAVAPSVRKNVRRAKNSGLEIEDSAGEESLKRHFYPLYLRSLRRLGSPPHPLSYFLSLSGNLHRHLRLLTAIWKGTPVAALLGWEIGGSVHITDIVSDERFFPLRAADLLHYEMISRAIASGVETFDFGPVRYPGQRQYKSKWGIELHPYSYFYSPRERGRRPLSDRSAAGRIGSFVWRRLPPSLGARAGKPVRRMLSI